MKKLIGKVLVGLNNKMVNANSASVYSVGVEEMPESMKKTR